jgi:ERCC4-related helicase
MVSTPQVLLDALRHGYINLGRDISLLVFDEAHHATDKHPYNMIMREFYMQCSPRNSLGLVGQADEIAKPWILGLTASPIFGGNIELAFKYVFSPHLPAAR